MPKAWRVESTEGAGGSSTTEDMTYSYTALIASDNSRK
jgi:hypothetical protein